METVIIRSTLSVGKTLEEETREEKEKTVMHAHECNERKGRIYWKTQQGNETTRRVFKRVK